MSSCFFVAHRTTSDDTEMAEPSRPLHPVPEADEDSISPVSSRRTPASFSPNLFRRSGYHRMDSGGAQEMADLEEPAAARTTSPPPAGTDAASDADGLGISWRPSTHRRVSSGSSISRRPVGAPKTSPPETPRQSQGLLDVAGSTSPPQARRQPSWDRPPPLEDRMLSPGPPSILEEPLPFKGRAAAIDGTPSEQSSRFPGHQHAGLSPDDDLEGDSFDDDAFYKKFGRFKSRVLCSTG